MSSLLLISSVVVASEYYAKLNPVNMYTVKSAVSGQITFVNINLEKLLRDK